MTALGNDDRELKAATRRLVKACAGGEGAAATIEAASGARVRQQRISDCGNENQPDFLRLNEVGYLEDKAERDSAWPHVTRALATRQGYLLIARPPVVASKSDWLKASAAASKEASDVQTAIADSLADDGEISTAEADRIISECDAGIERLLQLRALAEEARAR